MLYRDRARVYVASPATTVHLTSRPGATPWPHPTGLAWLRVYLFRRQTSLL